MIAASSASIAQSPSPQRSATSLTRPAHRPVSAGTRQGRADASVRAHLLVTPVETGR